jgi:hypothetical protein
MGKKPVFGLTALWIGLAVFGCDCCRNKGTYHRDPTFGPPAGAKDVSGTTTPGTPGSPTTSGTAGLQGSNPTGSFSSGSPVGTGLPSSGLSDPYAPSSRPSDLAPAGRTTMPSGLDSGTSLPSKYTPSSTGGGTTWNDSKSMPGGSGVTPASATVDGGYGSSLSGMGSGRTLKDDPLYSAPPAGKSATDALGSMDTSYGRGSALDSDRNGSTAMPARPVPTSLPSSLKPTIPSTLPPAMPDVAPSMPPAVKSTGLSSDSTTTPTKDARLTPPPTYTPRDGATAGSSGTAGNEIPPPPADLGLSPGK